MNKYHRYKSVYEAMQKQANAGIPADSVLTEDVIITDKERDAIERVLRMTADDPRRMDARFCQEDRTTVLMMLMRTHPLARLAEKWEQTRSEADRQAFYAALVKAGHGQQTNPDFFYFHHNGRNYRPLSDVPDGRCEIAVS